MGGAAKAGLSLGPVLFNWPPAGWRDFYFRVADEAPVDRVYLGEVVCAKRAPLFAPHLAEVAGRLRRAGKDVVLSTLALIMNESELAMVRDVAAGDDFQVEANDMAAAAMLKGRAHAIGPYVNVYNEGTLRFLARNGARSVALPVELSAGAIDALVKTTEVERDVALEVMVFGRMPLAISARCYHARSRDLSKDSCRFVCENDPDGLELDTLDGEPFLAVNGVQTLSYTFCNLVGELCQLDRMGVRYLRLSPQSGDMVRIADAFRAVLDDRLAPEDAAEIVAEEIGDRPISNGYFHGKEGAPLTGMLAE